MSVSRASRRLAVVAVVATTALSACARDTHGADWPDLVTARQQDAIDRGWIPEFLPEAARDLRQLNDPETGAGIVVASMAPDVDIPECGGQAPEPVAPPLEASWWPEPVIEEAVTCQDGWMLHRDGEQLALWNPGDVVPMPNASEQP